MTLLPVLEIYNFAAVKDLDAKIHAAVDLFSDDDIQGILQIDARNAFNSLNRKVHNIKILCPELSNFINNCYTKPARLFIIGEEIASSEGTTQGDQLPCRCTRSRFYP